MNYKNWESIEDTILKVWCDQESCEQLAERLNRSVGSVKSRLQTLGLKKKNVYKDKVWTPEMIEYLKSKAKLQSSKSIARNLGVSYHALKCKASRLGICLRVKKYKLWSDEEIETLKKTIPLHSSWLEISEKVGRRENACRKKAGELGLNLDLRKEWKMTELRYIHESRLNGLSYRKIAKELSRTEGSVRKRYARYKKETNIS